MFSLLVHKGRSIWQDQLSPAQATCNLTLFWYSKLSAHEFFSFASCLASHWKCHSCRKGTVIGWSEFGQYMLGRSAAHSSWWLVHGSLVTCREKGHLKSLTEPTNKLTLIHCNKMFVMEGIDTGMVSNYVIPW